MMFLAASSDANAKTLYLNPGILETGNAKFAAYYFNSGQTGVWTSDYLPELNDGIFQADIPDGYSTVIFCRMNPNAGLNWEGRWDQTEDLVIPSDKNLYTISSKKDNSNICLGSWSVYTPTDNPGGGGNTDPIVPSDYTTAVPSQCTDVMLQAFYWNSYTDETYGTSKWAALEGHVDEINSYFDLVWLPPSARASGGGMGYIPQIYSNQNCSFGAKTVLQRVIGKFHAGGTRVVADVVINHAGNNSGWCDFKPQDFGSFGYFEPKNTWITSNDEAKTEGKCSVVGSNADDGQHNANYGAARDWDHKNVNVQNMCKAYLKWLKSEMSYDGFRYDYAGGYHVSHINDYNTASQPYFSVMEYWDGNASNLKSRINQANKNTLTFDFAAYYTALQNGIAKNSYGGCKNAGLRGQGYSKYAVLFVDNHDTFNRNDTNDPVDVGGSKDGHTTLANRDLMLQCNAYILSMPGVPCVFWPHWYTYKAEIKKMIHARKAAGIHSESTMESESSGSGWYKATVVGKNGKLILYLGSAASEAAPSGYKQAIKDSKVAIYYTGSESWDVQEVQSDRVRGEKFIENGQLYIRVDEKVYDIQGRRVQ